MNSNHNHDDAINKLEKKDLTICETDADLFSLSA